MATTNAEGAGAAPSASTDRRPSPKPGAGARSVTGTRKVIAAAFLLPALVL